MQLKVTQHNIIQNYIDIILVSDFETNHGKDLKVNLM